MHHYHSSMMLHLCGATFSGKLNHELWGWFEKFLESPPDVSASTTRFLSNNHASFVSEHMARQCSCCRTMVLMSLFVKMEKPEIRVKRYESKGNSRQLSENTRDSALSYSAVAKWISKFKFDRESLDDLWSGWPRSATTPEFIAKVHNP